MSRAPAEVAFLNGVKCEQMAKKTGKILTFGVVLKLGVNPVFIGVLSEK